LEADSGRSFRYFGATPRFEAYFPILAEIFAAMPPFHGSYPAFAANFAVKGSSRDEYPLHFLYDVQLALWHHAIPRNTDNADAIKMMPSRYFCPQHPKTVLFERIALCHHFICPSAETHGSIG